MIGAASRGRLLRSRILEKGSRTRKLSEFFPEQSFMDKDEVIDQIIEAIAEDFTFAELLDVSYMRRELDKLIQIEDSKLVLLLFGALQLKTLRRRRRPLWQALCLMH